MQQLPCRPEVTAWTLLPEVSGPSAAAAERLDLRITLMLNEVPQAAAFGVCRLGFGNHGLVGLSRSCRRNFDRDGDRARFGTRTATLRLGRPPLQQLAGIDPRVGSGHPPTARHAVGARSQPLGGEMPHTDGTRSSVQSSIPIPPDTETPDLFPLVRGAVARAAFRGRAGSRRACRATPLGNGHATG